jgi:hypothetical protein
MKRTNTEDYKKILETELEEMTKIQFKIRDNFQELDEKMKKIYSLIEEEKPSKQVQCTDCEEEKPEQDFDPEAVCKNCKGPICDDCVARVGDNPALEFEEWYQKFDTEMSGWNEWEDFVGEDHEDDVYCNYCFTTMATTLRNKFLKSEEGQSRKKKKKELTLFTTPKCSGCSKELKWVSVPNGHGLYHDPVTCPNCGKSFCRKCYNKHKEELEIACSGDI